MATKKKTTRKKKSEPTAEEIWNSLKDQIGTEDAGTYTMAGKFEIHSCIDHPKFGFGFVIESQSNKVRVSFEDGERYLVQNRV